MSVCLQHCDFLKKLFDVLITVYIDDIIILSNKRDGTQWTKAEINSLFYLTDLGQLQYYSGASFQRERSLILLSQKRYDRNFLNQHGIGSAKTVLTSMIDDIDALLDENQAERLNENRYPYRSLVGSLIFLSTHTRPDICCCWDSKSFCRQNHNSTLES